MIKKNFFIFFIFLLSFLLCQTKIYAFNENEYINEVLTLINEERLNHHAKPLKLDPLLMKVANERLKEVEIKFSHYRPNGDICFTLFKKDGLKYKFAGENIVRGKNLTPNEAVNLWIDSPSHCYNLRRKIYTNTGIAVGKTEDGMVYYVQIFIKPKKV